MEILAMLNGRLDFICRFYNQAAVPFETIMNLINSEEGPLIAGSIPWLVFYFLGLVPKLRTILTFQVAIPVWVGIHTAPAIAIRVVTSLRSFQRREKPSSHSIL